MTNFCADCKTARAGPNGLCQDCLERDALLRRVWARKLEENRA